MSDNTFDLSPEKFRELYNIIEGEPEFEVYFSDHSDEYMIIKYADRVSFQRCGASNGSGEIYFDTLDTLFAADTIDSIRLDRDWGNITDIIVDAMFNLSDKNDIATLYANRNENGTINTFSIR
ncbi:MAG: hypothetical protein IK093_11100 [Ruminiclostridium sp.]|nr:hypothetical protein [Ruminiclostridium sp.]